MAVDRAKSFKVFHGTEGRLQDLTAGLSGRHAYPNIALDPFMAVEWSRETPEGLFRVSVWDASYSDIKPSYYQKTASIERPFSKEEKRTHLAAFKNTLKSAPSILKAKAIYGSQRSKIVSLEKERVNGLPGDRCLYIIDLTSDQKKYLTRQPYTFQSQILHSIVADATLFPVVQMERTFLQLLPDIELLRIHKINGVIENKHEILKQMFRQSLLLTTHQLIVSDDLGFLQNNLIDLANHGLLEKPIDYYRGSNFDYKIWRPMIKIAHKVEEELIRFYPDLKVLLNSD